MNPTLKRTLIASGVAMAMGSPVTNAALVEDLYGAFTWHTDKANFTMLGDTGALNSGNGTNDVVMDWDGNAYSNISDYTGPGLPGSASNVTAKSTSLFQSHLWTAHDIQVFTPGDYSFNVTLGDAGTPTPAFIDVTVPDGQLGMHMLFDWNGTFNIDVVVVAAGSSLYGAGKVFSTNNVGSFTPNNCTSGVVKNCLWDGGGFLDNNPANRPFPNQAWMLATVDGDGDGVMGIQMIETPFATFNAGFNATMAPTPKVPIPAAAWLFGTGLLGLVGVARRKKGS